MNRKLTLSAITMFAVILGLSSLGPAMAKADTTICHFAEEETVLVDMDGDGIFETLIDKEEGKEYFKKLREEGKFPPKWVIQAYTE